MGNLFKKQIAFDHSNLSSLIKFSYNQEDSEFKEIRELTLTPRPVLHQKTKREHPF